MVVTSAQDHQEDSAQDSQEQQDSQEHTTDHDEPQSLCDTEPASKSQQPQASQARKRRKTTEHRLYIMTLAVLPAYRGRQIGTQLVQSILNFCEQKQNEDSSLDFHITEILLHVQTSNTDAIRFYVERFQFIQGDLVRNYYHRVDPPDCYVLFRPITRTISAVATSSSLTADVAGDVANEDKHDDS
jgi:ribosomal protein S18 acetylase RimI-like enzyme